MKKFLALLICGCMAYSLAACGSSGTSNQSPSATSGETIAETEGAGETEAAKEPASNEKALAGLTIGFAQTDSMSSWRTTETDSIQEAVEAAGGTLIVKDAQSDIATQASDISDLIAAGVDCLVVAPLEDNGLQDVLVEAMESGIPVILVDRAINGEAGTHYTTAIASDFIWEGEQCALALNEALPNGGNVVIINGGYESSTSTDRQKGFVDNLNDNFSVIAEQNGNWLMADAQDVMENIIQAQGGENIDAAFAVTDDMIQGAKNAIEANGLVPGQDILLLGIDGTAAALESVADGTQLASCTCTPYFGPIVVETLTRLLNGENVETAIVNPDTIYTIDNVDVSAGF
ncbi:MAG: ABC transporter substrate-binding protein [Clostridiales bacterium]|nr:ABC transporter substrate-binding protein [Clostridiales bacterium]